MESGCRRTSSRLKSLLRSLLNTSLPGVNQPISSFRTTDASCLPFKVANSLKMTQYSSTIPPLLSTERLLSLLQGASHMDINGLSTPLSTSRGVLSSTEKVTPNKATNSQPRAKPRAPRHRTANGQGPAHSTRKRLPSTGGTRLIANPPDSQ